MIPTLSKVKVFEIPDAVLLSMTTISFLFSLHSIALYVFDFISFSLSGLWFKSQVSRNAVTIKKIQKPFLYLHLTTTWMFWRFVDELEAIFVELDETEIKLHYQIKMQLESKLQLNIKICMYFITACNNIDCKLINYMHIVY